MTSIAGVGGSSSSELLQMLQELSRKRAEATSTSTQSSQAESTGRATLDESFDNALVSAGLDESQLDEVKSRIKSAITEALSSTDASSDPRATVAAAVDATLAEFRTDPQSPWNAELKRAERPASHAEPFDELRDGIGTKRLPGGLIGHCHDVPRNCRDQAGRGQHCL